MNYLNQENEDNKSKGRKMLKELKEKEKKIKFHSRRINKNTIVYCKNENRLDDYENSYNNIKNW